MDDYDNRFIIIDDEDDIVMENLSKSVSSLNIDKKPNHISVMSIDVGILHLGISITLVNEEYNMEEIVLTKLIDITDFPCNPDECVWGHTKTIADWMSHVFHYNYDMFDNVDHILIEKQPPQGLVSIEQMIYLVLRDKCTLIHPRSVHKYYNIGDKDYEERKRLSDKIAERYLKKYANDEIIKQYNQHERKHDISDSLLFCGYWCHIKRKEKELEVRKERLKQIKFRLKNGEKVSIDEMMEKYRYVK